MASKKSNNLSDVNDNCRQEDSCKQITTTDLADQPFQKNEIRIVLIGITGSGKSATGNTILGIDHFDSKPSGSSVTKQCDFADIFRDGKNIIVVDTPGIFDTSMSNEEVTKEIVKCVGISAPGPHAFILVVQIGRFTEEEVFTVNHFIQIFGEGILKYMIVLFTRKDDIDTAGDTIEAYVSTVPEYLKNILKKCGQRYIAFNNKAETLIKEEQVRSLLKMIRTIIADNDGLYYSNEMYKAAEKAYRRFMAEERQREARRKEEEIEKIKQEYVRQFEKKLRSVEQQCSLLQKQVHQKEAEVEDQQEVARDVVLRIPPLVNMLLSEILTKTHIKYILF